MTLLTEAFRTAATLRARTLGMPQHPTVVLEHPMASKTEAQVHGMAERFVESIMNGLIRK